jgi:hypothetical protein
LRRDEFPVPFSASRDRKIDGGTSFLTVQGRFSRSASFGLLTHFGTEALTLNQRRTCGLDRLMSCRPCEKQSALLPCLVLSVLKKVQKQVQANQA